MFIPFTLIRNRQWEDPAADLNHVGRMIWIILAVPVKKRLRLNTLVIAANGLFRGQGDPCRHRSFPIFYGYFFFSG
jgi:hypothetical protein